MPSSDRQPISVARNQWIDIEVPDLGSWTPGLPVTVVSPFYQRSRELNLTLAALGEQTYPMSLLQVIVVDDGSPTDPPNPPADLGFDLQVVTQEDLGYGLARARNLGASLAESEFVIFLDCDMIPEREYVEAHARWHSQASALVTVGFRYHADFSWVTAQQVAEAVRTGSPRDLFLPEDVESPEWIDRHMERLEEFLGPADDFWRVMSGGNLGVDRSLYLEAGGTDESFTRWGGEDNELGYRLLQLGAVVIPDRRATAWHQGDGHEPTPEDEVNLKIQRPKLAGLIPDLGARAKNPGRQFERPYLTVFVDPLDLPAELVGLTVDSILGSQLTDLVIGVGKMDSDDSAEFLANSFGVDQRVVLDTTEKAFFDTHAFSPVRVLFPAGYVVEATTMSFIAEWMGGSGPGLLHFTLPGTPPSERLGRAYYTRAINRVIPLNRPSMDVAIGELFGERWVSGPSLGVWEIKDIDAARDLVLSRPRGMAEALYEARLSTERLERRRVLRLADGLGSLLKSRSWTERKAGLRQILGVFRRDSSTGEGSAQER